MIFNPIDRRPRRWGSASPSSNDVYIRLLRQLQPDVRAFDLKNLCPTPAAVRESLAVPRSEISDDPTSRRFSGWVNKKLGTEGKGKGKVRYYRQRQDDQSAPDQQRYDLIPIHLSNSTSFAG